MGTNTKKVRERPNAIYERRKSRAASSAGAGRRALATRRFAACVSCSLAVFACVPTERDCSQWRVYLKMGAYYKLKVQGGGLLRGEGVGVIGLTD